jgi:transposase
MKNSVTAVCMHVRLRADAPIAKLFGVGVSFIKSMLRMDWGEEKASLSLNEEQLETLQAAVEVCPDATLEELQRLVADQCKVTVSQLSICRAMKELNLPLAKRGGNTDQFHSPGQQETSP